jgi:hypothetical protein
VLDAAGVPACSAASRCRIHEPGVALVRDRTLLSIEGIWRRTLARSG